jgi:hypothetical protein
MTENYFISNADPMPHGYTHYYFIAYDDAKGVWTKRTEEVGT